MNPPRQQRPFWQHAVDMMINPNISRKLSTPYGLKTRMWCYVDHKTTPPTLVHNFKVMKILILDDEQVRHDYFKKIFSAQPEAQLTHVTTVAEAIDELEKNSPFDLVHLDHDLQDTDYMPYPVERTGADVAHFITRFMAKELHPARVVVHSVNSVGGPNIRNILQDAGIPVVWAPFPTYE